MASPSILRAGMRSPIHALMKPSSTKSILKKPAPLPLSPKLLPFAASFSILINSPRPSPHVHFPSSPAMAATFTAYSPNTYDRGPMTISPESPGLSGWASRQLSPSAHDAFKLLAPPTPIKRKSQARQSQLLAVPAFEDPRSPKPYKEAHKTPATTPQLLSVPPSEDPRSPKPYKPRAGTCLQELTLHVPRPRAAEELGKALCTYPRSPYPSAPIEDDTDVPASADMDVDMDGAATPERGRLPTKSGRPHPAPSVSRARSLENDRTRHRAALAQAQHVASPLRQSFLSPVAITVAEPVAPVKSNMKVKVKPLLTPLDFNFDLETEFWESMTLEAGSSESVYMTATTELSAAPGSMGVLSPGPVPDIMFGGQDGEVWSPRAKTQDRVRAADIGPLDLLSPVQRQRKALSKGMVASPSPHDPSAAFPSFAAAMSRMDVHGNVAYPPPVRVVPGGRGTDVQTRVRVRDVSD